MFFFPLLSSYNFCISDEAFITIKGFLCRFLSSFFIYLYFIFTFSRLPLSPINLVGKK